METGRQQEPRNSREASKMRRQTQRGVAMKLSKWHQKKNQQSITKASPATTNASNSRNSSKAAGTLQYRCQHKIKKWLGVQLWRSQVSAWKCWTFSFVGLRFRFEMLDVLLWRAVASKCRVSEKEKWVHGRREITGIWTRRIIKLEKLWLKSWQFLMNLATKVLSMFLSLISSRLQDVTNRRLCPRIHNSSGTQRNRVHCQKWAGKEKSSVIACTKTNWNKLVSGIVKKTVLLSLQMKVKTTIQCREKASSKNYVACTHIDDSSSVERKLSLPENNCCARYLTRYYLSILSKQFRIISYEYKVLFSVEKNGQFGNRSVGQDPFRYQGQVSGTGRLCGRWIARLHHGYGRQRQN